ncbi:hypothetical protein ACLMAJ_15875 [Nocardia sp. KC 131]|uniref:hypothetical protein n=1 Tax=Nocardia arseniciresistens TaxID=3392119 RepID=UPI00398E9C85
MHSYTVTNVGGRIVIFDTNIANHDDNDPDDPERIPRVRTREEWQQSHPRDIEKAYIAELAIDDDNNLTNLHPIRPNQATPRKKGKLKGLPDNNDDAA